MGTGVTVVVVLLIIMFGLLIFSPVADNELSRAVTGITLDDIPKNILGEDTNKQTTTEIKTQTKTQTATVTLSIDDFCETVYPDGFGLPESNSQALSGCWSVDTLMIRDEGCSERTLLNGETHTYCFADGAFEQFPAGGIGFVANWCDMGKEWAICSGSLAPPILSFFSRN